MSTNLYRIQEYFRRHVILRGRNNISQDFIGFMKTNPYAMRCAPYARMPAFLTRCRFQIHTCNKNKRKLKGEKTSPYAVQVELQKTTFSGKQFLLATIYGRVHMSAHAYAYVGACVHCAMHANIYTYILSLRGEPGFWF